MRGKKAKAIRKEVYGANSIRVKTYIKGHEPKMGAFSPDGKWYRPNPTCICSGLRRAYQGAKRRV